MTGIAVFNEDFNEFINDTGIQIKPGGRETLSLGDIYVFPDLDILSPGRLTGAGPPRRADKLVRAFGPRGPGRRGAHMRPRGFREDISP